MGSPARPSRTYIACDAAPQRAPRTSPAIAVKKNCSVMEESAKGMRINAPTAVSAANTAQRSSIRVLVLLMFLTSVFSYSKTAVIYTMPAVKKQLWYVTKNARG